MAIKDLIPWNNRGREVGLQRSTEVHPFLTLHRETNRMFDDVFRGFDLAPFVGVLSISGEKKSKTEDKARRFSERYLVASNGVFRWRMSRT
jgi:HSP20 family protein